MSVNSPRDRPLDVQEKLGERCRRDAQILEERRRLKQEIERATHRFEATRASISETWERLVRNLDGGSLHRDLRRAALNLLEDTERARLGEEAHAASRERAEAGERASEARYRTLFESIDEGFCIIEVLFDEGGRKCVDYRFLEVNPAFERHTGLANAAGRTMREFLPGHDDFWFETYGRIALTGEPARFEHRAEALGRDYDVYAFRVEGAPEHEVAILFTDITQRKRDEANLAFLADVSQDLVRLTNIEQMMGALGAKIGAHFRVSHCAFGEVDEAQQTVTFAHEWKVADLPSFKGARRLADHHTEEFQRASRAGETYVVRDVAADARVNAGQMTALGIGAFVSVPLLRDGKWRFNLKIYDSAPRDWRADEIELLRELTARIWTRLERARAEEALRAKEAELDAIINETPFMLTRCTRDLRYRYVSRAYAAMLCRTPNEINGKSIREVMGEEGWKTIAPHVERVLRGERVEYEDKVDFLTASEPCLHVIYTPDTDEQGNVNGWFGSIVDITERKRAENALEESLRETEKARAEAEAAGRAKDHFLAVLSHELRTPLTPVLMSVDFLMLDPDLPPQVIEGLEMIQRNVALESQLIDELLDLTRIARGKFELSRELMDLHRAIQLAAEVVMADIEGKAQRLTFALHASAHELGGDCKRLQQVFWNLLKNASKFTPARGEITIRSRNEPRAANEPAHIVVDVTDTGIGFDAEAAGKIFDAFTQANESITQEFGGLGLGLAISKATIDAHGGSIRGTSPGAGQGATFTVSLPLSEP